MCLTYLNFRNVKENFLLIGCFYSRVLLQYGCYLLTIQYFLTVSDYKEFSLIFIIQIFVALVIAV